MKRKSALIDRGGTSARHETGFLTCEGVATLIASLTLLFIPAMPGKPAFIFAASWLLLILMAFAFLRMVLFSRGFADIVMSAFVVLFYGLLGWSLAPYDVASPLEYRVAICTMLVFLGLSRLAAFAQLINHQTLPLLPVCGVAEVVAGVLLLMGVPDSGVFYLYFIPGLTILLSGFGLFSEAARIRGTATALHGWRPADRRGTET